MANTEVGFEEEIQLAKDLKEHFCNKSGKETNLVKAGEIIHKLGLIYRRRSPDKFSLIKCVGLLNAAIVRNPINISEIKADLVKICQHILQEANAKNQKTDLIKKAALIKASFTKLRREVAGFLKNRVNEIPNNATAEELQKLKLKKISVIQQLNKIIAEKYTQAMAELSEICEDIMGKSPCAYAIAGMGSLAREEITPYSDYEHIILLCDVNNCKSHLEYFRWYSVIFHVIILNMQESIIPSLNIRTLNNDDSTLKDWYYDAVTPRGISFDGMMPHACKFPLGRLKHTKIKKFSTELIKPVSKMLEYLNSEEDLKNGYHLADILTNTCYVFGNKNIFEQFKDGVISNRRRKTQTNIITNVQQQVKEDLNNFSTRFRLTKIMSQDTINIKQFVYRSTTIFIAALARIYNISTSSSFDIINKMAKTDKITQTTAEKLQFAIATACEIRLRVYMENKSQCDNAINLKQDGIEKFLKIVGVVSTVNYFQIAYCLQCQVAKELSFTKLHFYSDPQLINITIGLAFGIKDLIKFQKHLQNRVWHLNEFDFDSCIEFLENEIELTSANKLLSPIHPYGLNPQQIISIADYLFSTKVYDEALDFYKQLLEIYNSKEKEIDEVNEIAWVNDKIGLCLNYLNQPANALVYLNQAFVIYLNATPSSVDAHRKLAKTYHNLGRCQINLSRYSNALQSLHKELKIYQNIETMADTDKNIATTLHSIGRCHAKMNQYLDAFKYLHQALEIKRSITVNVDTDRNIAATYYSLARCHMGLHQYETAMIHLNEALTIRQNTLLSTESDRSITAILLNLGCCKIEIQQYQDAQKYLNKTLKINKGTSLDEDNDLELAVTKCTVGRCLTGLQQYNESWIWLEQALKIFRNITLDESKDDFIAYTYNSMAECLFAKQHYEEALSYLQGAFKIHQNNKIQLKYNTKFARTLFNLGVCLMEMKRFTDALNHLKQSLKIFETLPVNEYVEKKIEAIQTIKDRCLLNLR